MGKINYKKVEKSLSEGLLKMSVDQLLELADLASIFETDRIKKELSEEEREKLYTITLGQLKRDLKRLRREDRELYRRLKIDPEEFKRFFAHPEKLSEEEWRRILQIGQELQNFKKQLKAKLEEGGDEALIERQRADEIRLNTREGWKAL